MPSTHSGLNRAGRVGLPGLILLTVSCETPVPSALPDDLASPAEVEEVTLDQERSEPTPTERAPIHVLGVDNERVLLFVDGERRPDNTLPTGLDPATISSWEGYVGDEAIDKFGEAGRHGVIKLYTEGYAHR